jgi:hypothetical protein
VHGVREALDELTVHATAAALVGVRGVGEAVAQHPFAARERWTDEIVDVYLTRAEHEQRSAVG